MEKQDYQRFVETITFLAAVCQVELTDPLRRGYARMCKDMPIEDFERACEKAGREVNTYGRLPLPGRLLELASGQNHDQRAAMAWTAVLKQIELTGTGRGVDFDDPLINGAVRSIGGWVQLGQTHPDQLDWRRREFLAAYKQMLVEGADPGLTAPLDGHGVSGDRAWAATGLDGVRDRPALGSGSEMSAGEVLEKLGVEVRDE